MTGEISMQNNEKGTAQIKVSVGFLSCPEYLIENGLCAGVTCPMPIHNCTRCRFNGSELQNAWTHVH
jgi:hypothetical protein